MILLIDNYDSFTYNLKQYLMELDQDITVYRNDEITLDDIEVLKPSHIIISPGPGRPDDAGISIDVIKRFSGKIPILGVCLGHQSIGQAFGGNVISAKQLMHGKVSKIKHDNKTIFAGIPNYFDATRYHSLAIERSSIPDVLEVSAETDDGEIMGVRHKSHLTEGIQVHPESILTTEGKNVLKNFLLLKYQQEVKGIMIKQAIQKVIDNYNLADDEAEAVMEEIMTGNATGSQIGAFLTALRLKGETVNEITAFANVMRSKSVKIRPKTAELLDTCGTGGDGSGTFNISTAAAFVIAGAGIKVAKHGNRGISSKTGSADVLESLGVKIDMQPDAIANCIDNVGLGFMFAQTHHPAMKYAGPTRKEIGIRTVFNFLGPLTNPAQATYQVMGVPDNKYVEKIASVLKNLGVVRGYVVSSEDGLDEVSIAAPTMVAAITSKGIKISTFKPKDVGYKTSSLDNVIGGDSDYNAEIIRNILNGEKGPKRDIVCLNAGFAISAKNDVSIKEGVRIAEEVIDSGKAKAVLEKLVEISSRS